MPYRAAADVEDEPVAPEAELPDVEPGPVALRVDENREATPRAKAWAYVGTAVIVMLATMGLWVRCSQADESNEPITPPSAPH